MSHTFKRIICVDNLGFSLKTYQDLQRFSKAEVCPHESDPSDNNELLARIGDADCALVSWRTPLGAEVIQASKSLRYIGLCASKYTNPDACNIDLRAARDNRITVTAAGQYGDEATAEYIFYALLSLCRGFEKIQWRKKPSELFGKKLGIIGMGVMGKQMLKLALGFCMQVSYFSKTRKPECEKLGAIYLSKSDLLKNSDIVSLHVPKGSSALSEVDFCDFSPNSILVNTSLGLVFPPRAFATWIEKKDNIVIMDGSVDRIYQNFRELPNVFVEM
jgi:lactate dehydrogenase-like 2-hydroxyacid dehydrogenase